jgi:hypothetical protein
MVWTDLACRLQQIHCNGIDGKTYLQNKALEIRIECCLDETEDAAEDLVQEEPCELDAV